MNGCYVPGYIFIPEQNLWPAKPIPNRLNGMLCSPAEDGQTFAKGGLPLVNETAIIKGNGKHIYFEPMSSSDLDPFAPIEPRFAADKRTCHADWHEPEGWRIEQGTRVRVLGYRTFVGQETVTVRDPKNGQSAVRKYPRQLLFALVMVAAP